MRWIPILPLALMLAGCGGPHESSVNDSIRAGENLWRHGDFLSAAAFYEQAGEKAPEAPEVLYDLALAYHRAKLDEAATRYLDRAQAVAQGELRVRCLLLRGDVEYRRAMAESAIRRVEGLERALTLYRDALAAGGGSKKLSDFARYDVEVVKLQLPSARSGAPEVRSQGRLERDASPDEMSSETGADSRQRRQAPQDDQDW